MPIHPMLVASCVAALSAATSLEAQATPRAARGMMDGVVMDTALGPLPGATVALLGSTITVTTGDNGRFRIVDLPAGDYVVIVRRLGYSSASATLRMAATDTLRPTFALRPVEATLDTVRVSSRSLTPRLAEFEERRGRKVGHFITADEIDKRNPMHIADMLRSILSVRIIGRAPGIYVALSMRTPAGCPFQIFVDGQMFSELGDLSSVPPPRDIAGIEVYSGPATIPLEYKRHDTQCGVILIWTKVAPDH